MQVYSLWDLQIDKTYCSLKEAESKKNAAVRAKHGVGKFWFDYFVNPDAKSSVKPKSFEQVLVEIGKEKARK